MDLQKETLLNEELQEIEIFDKPGLFSNGRLRDEEVPEGLYRYDLRGSDYDPGQPVTVEKTVVVNHSLNPFEMKVQGIDRTLADKVFAVCDYYLQGKVAKHSRHLYDIYKLLPLVPQDENFRELVKEVRAVRAQSVICPSALPEANVPELLKKIIREKAYKQDYDNLTSQLLEKNVPYDTVIAALKQVAESSLFEKN